MAQDVVIRLSADASGVQKGVHGAVQSLGTLGEESKKIAATMGAYLGGALSIGAFTSKLVSVQREFDVLNSSLITVTGSSAAAAREFAWIKEFAATTPYALNEVTQGFVRMKSLGLDATEGALRSYGNTASAMGKSLDQMIEAVADASTGEFERLKEFGIRASKEGDRVSLTFQGVTKTIGNSAAEISGYLRDIGDIQFGGAMEDRAKTLDGALSNLGDTWDGLFLTISQQNAGGLIYDSVTLASGAIGDAIDILDAMNRATEENAKQTGAATAIQEGLAITFETVAVLGANVAYVLEGIGREIGGLAAQAAMAAQLDFSGAAAIGDMMKADAAAARATIDAQTESILNARANAAEYRQVLESARAGTVDYSASVARLIEMQNAGTISAQQFRVAVESLQPAAKGASGSAGGLGGALGGTKKAAKEANDAIEDLLLKLDAKAMEEAAKAVDDYNQAWSDYLDGLDKTARGLDEQIEQYGMTEAQIAAVTLRRAEDRLEMARASKGVMPDYIAALEREVELRRQIAASAGNLEALDANKAAADEAARDWERTAAAIEDSLIDALMDGGKSGAEYIEGLFRSMVLRPVLQAIVSPVANAITGTLGLGAPGSGGAGGLGWLSTGVDAYSKGSSIYDYGMRAYNWAFPAPTLAVGGTSLASMGGGTGLMTNVGYGSQLAGTYGGLGMTQGGGLGMTYTPTSYAATSGSTVGGTTAAGASGMMSSLATAGAYAAIAMAVVSLIGDIFGDDPDPRLRYKMSNDFDSAGGWEDGVAYAEGAFGFVGLDDATSKDVKGRKFKEQIEALAAFDTMLASVMSREEIAAVRSGMDGWMSSANRNTRDYRRDPDLALAERLIGISESAGGEQWEEVLSYIRSTSIRPDAQWGVLNPSIGATENEQYGMVESAIPIGTTIADLYGFDTIVTSFADAGEAGAKALQGALRKVAAESVMDPSHPDYVGYSQTWLDDQVSTLIGDMPQSLDDLSTALQGFGLTIGEIEQIAIDAANAPFGTGRPGKDLANAAQLDGEALAQYILRGFQADNVQSMLEKVGQGIGRDAARAWMDASTTKVVGEDGKETPLDGYGVLMDKLAQGYALLYQTAADTWGQAQANLAGMFDALDVAMPGSIDGFKALAEAQDLNTAAGRALYMELMALAPAFADFANAQQALYDQLLTDEQRMARATADVSAAFADLGVALPATRDEMRALIDAQDATTEAGARMKAQLLGLVPAFVEVSDAAARAAEEAAQAASRTAEEAARAAANAVSKAESDLRAAYNREMQAAAERVSSAESVLRSAYEKQRSELEATAARFKDFARSIADFRRELAGEMAGPRSLALLRGEFTRTSDLARLGDEDAMGRLLGTSREYLDAAEREATSQEDYLRTLGYVSASLEATEGIALSQEKIAEQSLRALKDQVARLIDINNHTLSVEEAIRQMEAAMLADNRTALTEQVGKLIEINTSVLSVKDAIAALAAAQAAAKAAAPAAYQPYSVSDTPALRQQKVEAQTGVAVSSNDPALVAAAKVLYQSINGGASTAQYNAAAAAVGGNIAAAVGWDGSREGAESLRKIYGFASGGLHTGGLRLVGEEGPELEVTGPSRIYNAAQTRDLLNGGSNEALLAEIRALRAEVAQMRAASEATARNTSRLDRNIDRVTEGGRAMQTEAYA